MAFAPEGYVLKKSWNSERHGRSSPSAIGSVPPLECTPMRCRHAAHTNFLRIPSIDHFLTPYPSVAFFHCTVFVQQRLAHIGNSV